MNNERRIGRREFMTGGVIALVGLAIGKEVKAVVEDPLVRENRQDAENLVAYRQGVDAERTVTTAMGFQPQSLSYYELLYKDGVSRAEAGENPLSPGFWKNTEPKPTPAPLAENTPTSKEGGENK